MEWLGAVGTQVRVWRGYRGLRSPDDAVRDAGMEALYAAGSAALPCLRYAAKRIRDPRAQFAAAVVLHRLGEPEGMATLMEALRWRLPSNPGLAPELERALMRIDLPDAVTALLDTWYHMPDWGDHSVALASICRVWAAARDPRALEALTVRAGRIPDLFEQTVPAFGEMAIEPLRRMAADADSFRRILAIRALRHIAGGRSFAALVPLLRDPEPLVRAEVPAALEATGRPYAAAEVIQQAIGAGYSTHAAVHTLIRVQPPRLQETLLALLSRWDPRNRAGAGDTQAAVLAALIALTNIDSPDRERLLPILCALLDRKPDPELAIELAKTLGRLGTYPSWKSGKNADPTMVAAFWKLLVYPAANVRTVAAQALLRLEEPLGKQMLQILEECGPQGNLLSKLNLVLRGGPDASQAASQALQQVSGWFARVSREAAERWNKTPPDGPTAAALRDPRLPALLRDLLSGALDTLSLSVLPEEVEAPLSLCVAAIRALARVGTPGALCARAEMLRALYCVSNLRTSPAFAAGPEIREVGALVRAAAAETLFQLYGAEVFALLLEALYAFEIEVQETAILALGRLGDVRALLHLQAFANQSHPTLAGSAREAIAAIRLTNPEMMELLRASERDLHQPATLLRPASGETGSVAPDVLLRPAESP